MLATDPWPLITNLFTLADLLRQSVHSRLAGYEDRNDAQRLSQDPTFWLIGAMLGRIAALPLPAG